MKMNGPERQKGEREKLRAVGVCSNPLGGWVTVIHRLDLDV